MDLPAYGKMKKKVFNVTSYNSGRKQQLKYDFKMFV